MPFIVLKEVTYIKQKKEISVKPTYPPDPSGMTYSQIARRLGIKPVQIFVMRNQQPAKFAYIKNLNDHFEKGFIKYRTIQQETIGEMESIYYELEDNEALYKFASFLFARGVYQSETAWATSAKECTFRYSTDNISHTGLLKRMEGIDAYEDFDYERID